MGTLEVTGTLREKLEARYTGEGQAVVSWRMPVDEPAVFTRWPEFTAWGENAVEYAQKLEKGDRITVVVESIGAKHNKGKDRAGNDKDYVDVAIKVGLVYRERAAGGGLIERGGAPENGHRDEGEVAGTEVQTASK